MLSKALAFLCACIALAHASPCPAAFVSPLRASPSVSTSPDVFAPFKPRNLHQRTSAGRNAIRSRFVHPARSNLRVTMQGTDKPEPRLVVGMNKYTHDTSICIARQDTGEVLMMWSKERHSRKKHDGGDVASVMQTALENLGMTLEHVELVVSNNHHFRVLPYEKSPQQLAWSAHLRHVDDTYASEWNLVPNAKHKELSHHLAHAWSAASQAPFDQGLVVVMDGMGESFEAMGAADSQADANYFNDLKLERNSKATSSSSSSPPRSVPEDIQTAAARSTHGFREGETIYEFRKYPTTKHLSLSPVLKRWQQERSPPTLYNGGFENMESLGAVYSRVSSAIFGDWNACGKVMGLAPWDSVWNANGRNAPLPPLMKGRLTSAQPGDWTVHWDALQALPLAGAKYDVDAGLVGATEGSDASREAARLAAAIQKDLETAAMDLVREIKAETGQSNLVLCGGVALNSVLNGRLQRELDFDQTYIPPYPGDDGIAVGCCAYGLFAPECTEPDASNVPKGWERPLSPYLGPTYSEEDIQEALDSAEPFLEVEEVTDEERRVAETAGAVAAGEVVAWWTGRSEAGPRALGHRSLLADPRNASMVQRINGEVKGREAFRPFAPSVLAEEAHAWFEGVPSGEGAGAVSPYMSVTVTVRPGREAEIPAVTHVDRTSRLQTVTAEHEPLYHRLITAFLALTGVPMVLNTSFNTLRGEPITETPADAVRSFLARPAVDRLVLDRWVVRRRRGPVATATAPYDMAKLGPLVPVAVGPYQLETSMAVSDGFAAVTRVQVSMPASVRAEEGKFVALTDDLEAALLEACDGETTVADMVAEFVGASEQGEEVSLSDVLERLQHMHEECLVFFSQS